MEPLEQAPQKSSRKKTFNPRCLHEIFEAQADQRPDSQALVSETLSLSYRELDARANRLAHFLRAQGAAPGKFVGLYVERNAQAVTAILAVLKTGAAYIPLDPSYPQERIHHILVESEAVILLTDEAHAPKAKAAAEGLHCPVIALDASEPVIAKQSPRRLTRKETGLVPDDLCYVIYTSGTTGRPKGVMVEHRNVVAYVQAFNRACATRADDRVYQGFSLSFDGSIEEIWMAWSNGSALVSPDSKTPTFGAELGQYLTSKGVTYFSTVPTLLSTIPDSIPSLRTLVVSGEVCPPELVNRWAVPGLKMLNVYGPTEATVNTTFAVCLPGAPVTIGKPLEGYQLTILDPETLSPVQEGQKGELFVSGPTLARGYLNQQTLTDERFLKPTSVLLPGKQGFRLYRTGDLVRLAETGELEFFGRIDGQVKIRGYRVELAEIESILSENAGVRSAAVKVFERDGIPILAAYVIPAIVGEFDRSGVLTTLESRLPAYMIPATLDLLEEFPRLTSGKVDRGKLPEPQASLVRDTGEMIEPETPIEVRVASVWQRIFSLPKISVEDDFFLDLGGHSLVAAKMVVLLRKELGAQITVRDAYAWPTIRGLAGYIAGKFSAPEGTPGEARVFEPAKAPTKPKSTSRTVYEKLGILTPFTTAVIQAASIYLLHAVPMIPFALFLLCGVRWYVGQMSFLMLAIIWAGMALCLGPLFLSISIAAKWILIGRFRPGSHPVWGWYYLRWWLADRLIAWSGAGILVGTPLMSIYYRLMGAKVGPRCVLNSAAVSAWDLISIGEETSIGSDTQLLGYRIENGMLIFGRVDIGARCFVGIHSALGLGVRMENDSRLDDQSMLPDGQKIPERQGWRGSPAQPAEVKFPWVSPYVTSWKRRLGFGVAHLLAAEVMALIAALPGLGILLLAVLCFIYYGIPAGLAFLVALVPIGVVFSCLLIAGLKRLVLSKAKPGVYPVESFFYLRKWISDGIMGASRALLLPVYTTLYLPPWLRLMGSKIGPRAELSTVWAFSPELIDVGAESFFADGSIIGGKRFFRGRFEIGMNKIGRRSFVGNNAILPVGKSLGDRCLLGVQSITPAETKTTADGTEWLGSPPFSLPNRKKVEGFDESVTFHPTLSLYIQRAVIDGFRILIPGMIGLADGVGSIFVMYWAWKTYGVIPMLLISPLTGIVFGLVSILIVCALKWTVMGTFHPVIKPLWSRYVWLNEMVNGAYESVMAPAMSPYLGTPFTPALARLIGCKIGKRVYLGSTLFSEWDLVEIGDYAALNAGVVVQNHLFEDRVMKSSYLKIGAECSVGNMAVVLYDSEMQRGSVLGPLSLLMKGETLTSYSRWRGIPMLPENNSPNLLHASLEFHNVVGAGLRRGQDAKKQPEKQPKPQRVAAQGAPRVSPPNAKKPTAEHALL